MSISSELKDLLNIVKDNDMKRFIALFENNSIEFDSPLSGRIGNNIVAEPYIKQASYWLKDEIDRFECINQVIAQNRVYTEFMIYREYYNRSVDVPVAVMCDMENNKVRSMRVYHSCEYVAGHRVLRAAIMNPVDEHNMPKINRRYFDAIKNTDMKEIRETFAEKAYVRGSTKCDFYFENENLMTAFERFFAKGSIPLEHCTITQDDKNMIIEFVLVSWGRKRFIPQCGSAIYTVNNDGLLCALRIYDDIIM